MIKTSNLLDQAKTRTHLNDFGEESFLEPLERLVESINCDTQLTAIGERMLPEMLIGFLVNRLEVESWYKRHPEINDEQIVAPLFGIGLSRTGSTALGFMLALDPNTRVIREWESKQPCPPPESATEDNDPRIAEAIESSKTFETLVPELHNMLPRDPRGIAECAKTLCSTFLPSVLFEVWAHVPSYVDWCASAQLDMRPTYEYHKRVIKLLQWRCPPRRWFLRTPVHLFALDALDAVYPDAQYVMTHRDPVKSLPSTCSLLHQTRRVFIKNDDLKLLGKSQKEKWACALKKSLELRSRLGEERFFDVSHHRQVLNPLEQIRPLYAKLGWHLDDALAEQICQWKDTNPKGDHRFTLEEFGLTPDEIQQDYKFYIDKFKHYLG